MRMQMGNLGIIAGAALWMFAGGQTATAEVFHTARILKPGATSLALEPQVFLTDPLQTALNVHGGIGLGRGIDLGLRYRASLGESTLPQYLGMDFEIGLLTDRKMRPALSLVLGGHVMDWSTPGLDITAMTSKVLARFEPYLAVDCDVRLEPGVVIPEVAFVGGLDVHLSRVVEFLVEGGLGINSRPSYVGIGLNFYLRPYRRR